MKADSHELRRTLAANVRYYRAKRDLSQEDFADLCGFHRTYIGSIERCERNVTLSTLASLANVLGLSVPDLLTPHDAKED